ncbi:MAG TPA: MFS transporter [Sumerlaeia bacterium]|nr:MFS transporter [Sumerlaeia bacterium]
MPSPGKPSHMLFRFSCYGFLKDQRYFEPFIILAFREKGLSFFAIGLLVGFREVCIMLLDIPSGAAADLYGRRRCMVFSFSSYIVSFVVFALSDAVWMLFVAMFFFALGEVFRTGTHKAMIFDWLRRQGRENVKTRVYGFTRSWSKIGSALSALIAAALVFYSGSYSMIFWFCVPPYALNIINFLGYPKYLDGETRKSVRWGEMARFTFSALRCSVTRPDLRRLLGESVVFDGTFRATKDYLQPVLKQLALALPLAAAFPLLDSRLNDTQRSALIVGAVYFALNLLMSAAARNAHRFCERAGGEDRATLRLWWVNLGIYALLAAALLAGRPAAAAACFVAAGFVQNLFRPAQLSRYDAHSPPEMGATVLSVESQARSTFTMLAAPLIGYAVDLAGKASSSPDIFAFWPVAALGIAASALALAGRRRRRRGLGG